MAINKLLTADKFRFVDDSNATIAVISTIANDTYEQTDVDGNISVITPVYGSPYLKFDNPVSAPYTKGSISAEGTKAAFDALKGLVALGAIKPVSLVIGGTGFTKRTFNRCIITGVSTKQDLTKTTSWVTGQVSFIKL